MEPAGVASVSFECAGLAGSFEITARVGAVVSNTIVGNCVGAGVTVEVDSFSTTGDAEAQNVPKDIVLGMDSDGTANDEVYVVGRVLDAAGLEVSGATLKFTVTNSAGESQSLFVSSAASACLAAGDTCEGETKSGAGNAGGIAHVGVIDFSDTTLVKDTFTITATCTVLAAWGCRATRMSS